MEGVCFRKDGDGFESLGNGFGNWCLFLLISLVVSRDFVLGRGAAFGKMETVLKVSGMALESGGCFY